MPPKIQPKKEKLSWKIAGELRRSQMISTYGSGAIADFPQIVRDYVRLGFMDSKYVA